jgi:putative selenium metabolism protein SsnA
VSAEAKTLLVRGGRAFHGDPPRPLEGDLLIQDARVCGQQQNTLEKVQILDASGCLVLPGFVIGHHHLYSSLARGMPGPAESPGSFVEVLQKIWWRLDRALDDELSELSAAVGSLEALRCGVTGMIDHHASPNAVVGSLDRVAAGVQRLGARAVLCYETTDRHGAEGFEAGLAENQRLLQRPSGTVRGMVGGHAPFTLQDEQLRRLAELAAAHQVAVHLHVAESDDDQRDARERGAGNVVERLERAGVLDGQAVIAHGVHLSEAEIARLVESRAWLTHQPRSNMNNHVGYLSRARELGAQLALGTDGINGDLLAEAEAAFFRLREHDAQGAAETIWSWIAGAWRLQSTAFGLLHEHGFGWLSEGAPADVVVLDYDAPTPVTADNLAWHLAFGISARHVRDVVVAGEVVLRDREPTRVDRSELLREAHAGAERLWARMAAID